MVKVSTLRGSKKVPCEGIYLTLLLQSSLLIYVCNIRVSRPKKKV